MAVINTRGQSGGGSSKDFVLLPSDIYRMKVTKATVEENRFADPKADGSRPLQIVLTWEVTQLTEEQHDAAEEAGEDWDTAAVWQRLNPYYGPVRDGGVSKFQAFIDMLREQGYLADFDPDAFDPETLMGIEQRVNVELYHKSMGENAGKPGNKVVNVLALKRPRKTAKEIATPRNVPQPVAAGDIDDTTGELF